MSHGHTCRCRRLLRQCEACRPPWLAVSRSNHPPVEQSHGTTARTRKLRLDTFAESRPDLLCEPHVEREARLQASTGRDTHVVVVPAARELATWAETNDRWPVSGQLANGQV